VKVRKQTHLSQTRKIAKLVRNKASLLWLLAAFATLRETSSFLVAPGVLLMSYALFWSGGKDSLLALHAAQGLA
jgi:hypothetical protein